MTQAETKTVICGVCSGKGGWKVDVDFPWQNSWHDCKYCNGYGFYDTDVIVDEEHLIKLNKYRKLLGEAFDQLGNVISVATLKDDLVIEISVIPPPGNKAKNEWIDLMKALLKFNHFHQRLDLSCDMVYHYDGTKDRYGYYWKIILKPQSLSDLDGLVDLVMLRAGKNGKDNN